MSSIGQTIEAYCGSTTKPKPSNSKVAGGVGANSQRLRTTDLATLDADNFLWIKGRADNAIIRGGFKIIPEDVVRAMEQHPAVREAAVAAVPHPRLGQVPAAAYIAKAGAYAPSAGEFAAFLRDHLLNYQVPVKIVAVEELPRTPSMKVSLPELRKLLEPES